VVFPKIIGRVGAGKVLPHIQSDSDLPFETISIDDSSRSDQTNHSFRAQPASSGLKRFKNFEEFFYYSFA